MSAMESDAQTQCSSYNGSVKTCTKCKIEKPLDQFLKNKRYAGGHITNCLQCTAAYQKDRRGRPGVTKRQHELRLKRMYGLEVGGYDRMLSEQGGGCAICGDTDPGSRKHFDLDHCHKTGRIRGLLCSPCNRVLGVLDDDMEYAEKVIAYMAIYERDGK